MPAHMRIGASVHKTPPKQQHAKLTKQNIQKLTYVTKSISTVSAINTRSTRRVQETNSQHIRKQTYQTTHLFALT